MDFFGLITRDSLHDQSLHATFVLDRYTIPILIYFQGKFNRIRLAIIQNLWYNTNVFTEF